MPVLAGVYDSKGIMKKIIIEDWGSSENRKERHLFIGGTAKVGYQDNTYLFGYDPTF